MKRLGVRRLIFVTSLGIYDEIPGKFGGVERSRNWPVSRPVARLRRPDRSQ
ncbi:hypothetical protein [Pseudomonas aeruginosa]|uniref:hypothetical protein n=1 Tax=Pseudomonas aeruginosa TaxID=287 RepID=UPI0024C0B4FD|nr:hypothetical protein [Pseudomonas aeruginosa]WHV80221.1 hypothetical protein M2I96_12005 [Pseudomonas aeruginosa]